ncbi:MAG: response regulator transcription factor [Anaerovoracaceae bacterium]|jgi:two-component system copper resistance phosphate regulon response regulator CusR
MRLLVVEDQEDLNEIIVRKLKKENYAVDSCLRGDEALDYLKAAEYDGVILDIMLPGLTGIGVLKKMRAAGDGTPVLLLTALGDLDDRVAGLDAGADDYLVKPFEFDELMARIRAMVRRGGELTERTMTVGDLSLNRDTMEVTRGDRKIELTPKEFEILACLMERPGHVWSREKIMNRVWDFDYDGGSNVVDVYMHHLRKKLDGGEEKKHIATVKGVGYKLV